MQEWLDNNDILMYSRHNEDKSVIHGRFIKTIRKLTSNDSKYYLNYLNKLDQYNNAHHHFLFVKILLMLIILP